VKERLLSLDVFRGATIAAMIVVNNAGDGAHVYRQLDHAAWNGCTLTDLIFPFFVFIMGVSVVLAGDKGPGAILRRSLLIFGLGLVYGAFPFNFPYPVRIMGVLQRIAICYLVAALLSRSLGWRAIAAIALSLLVLYAGALLVDGDLTPEGNLGARIDRAVLGGHLWKGADWRWDPEGLLSTVPAIATALSGVLAGRWIKGVEAPAERTSGLFFAGLVLAALGLALDAALPINKQLWTSSYVLFTSGLACQAFGACYWLVDVHGVRAWTAPFVPFGRNAIFSYLASSVLTRVLLFVLFVHEGESRVALRVWLYAHLFPTSTCLTSAAFALGYAAIFYVVALVMDRRKIYVKV
jgi:predicted acyltransferase